ncbi:uncharacterized protein BDW43DRAFT_84299 [Aspergillus alliaceus]|uniref:uncharacterized protein n=1 Tax=Petromyces alliaceus TaxID=209559 RepID=UPI0012A3CDCF|nr:uncharacterized protein BDW43DRAFT_84299 [Aspergillus alliaceus]KAB8233676.1 hypothetical protein BDW43DRAFT_84299 [Aspergillus alliaceus]
MHGLMGYEHSLSSNTARTPPYSLPFGPFHSSAWQRLNDCASPPYHGESAKNRMTWCSITFFPPCASNVTVERWSQFQVALPSVAKTSHILSVQRAFECSRTPRSCMTVLLRHWRHILSIPCNSRPRLESLIIDTSTAHTDFVAEIPAPWIGRRTQIQ